MDIGPRFFLRAHLIKAMLRGEEGKLLDVGCGDGFFLKEMVRLGFSCTGIDISAKAIERCRARVESIGAEVYCISIEDFHPPQKFDVVVCGEVLEHVRDDVGFLKQITRLLKENGKLVISVPLDMNLWNKHDVCAGHYRRYTKDEIFAKLYHTGYKVERYVVWGYPLIRTLHFFLRREQEKRMGQDKRIPQERDILLKLKWILRGVKYLFLFDNIFNFTERGVGIIIKAKKESGFCS
jgi:SAM-dependent methyltransferase